MTNTQDELEQKLLKDPVFQHILKFAPESQRELMNFELAKYIAANYVPKEKDNEALDSLYNMYMQYCNDKWGHRFMGAGESASEILENAGYIVVNDIGAVVKDNYDFGFKQLTKENE